MVMKQEILYLMFLGEDVDDFFPDPPSVLPRSL
jgi:hypothetical protein